MMIIIERRSTIERKHPPKFNRQQIDDGSTKEKNHALVETQEDEGFNWNKYIPNDGVVLVAEVKQTQEERLASLDEWRIIRIFCDAQNANRWDSKRQCYYD
ncbi:hypothetical protein Hanom_Chr16g01453131 [Helianthus anomalus]